MARQILVVEDSVTIQRAVAISFAREDYAVTTAKSVDEGLAKAKQTKPDLVLADGGLPGKSGYDLCAAMRNDPQLAQVPCLILAGSAAPYDEAKATQARANGHVPKPFESQMLLDRVAEALKKGAAAPQPVAAAPAPAPAPRPAPAPAPVPQAAAPMPRATIMGIPVATMTQGAPAPAPVPAPAPAPVRQVQPIQPVQPAAPPAQTWSPPPAAAPAPAPAASHAPSSTIPAAAPQMPRAPMLPNTVAPVHYAAIASLSRELLEKVIWEVVPDLAETIIREQLDRLVREKQQSI
jgi:CheY-like chemotaxis protein